MTNDIFGKTGNSLSSKVKKLEILVAEMLPLLAITAISLDTYHKKDHTKELSTKINERANEVVKMMKDLTE